MLHQLSYVTGLCNGVYDVTLFDLSTCVFVCVDVPAELSDELGQQYGGHQAPAGPQRRHEGARSTLRHGPVAH